MGTEYATISGINSTGDVQWTYTTPTVDMTELSRMEEIGLQNGKYYFNESGTIVALDPDTGDEIWRNNDFGGASICFAFADNGDLFLAGYYGPHLFWIDENGNTVKRVESINPRYYWPVEIRTYHDYVDIVMAGTPDGYGEYVLTVSLASFVNEEHPMWRQAYLSYLQDNVPYNPYSEYQFQLVYVDNDDIPELWICSGIIAEGAQVCTYNGQDINYMYISEYGDFQYVEKGGVFYTSGGHMDEYWDGIYEIRNGQFVERAFGNFGAEDNSNIQYDENNEPIYQYNWEGTRVSEQEYKNCLAQAFDTSVAHDIFDGPIYNYTQIQQALSE